MQKQADECITRRAQAGCGSSYCSKGHAGVLLYEDRARCNQTENHVPGTRMTRRGHDAAHVKQYQNRYKTRGKRKVDLAGPYGPLGDARNSVPHAGHGPGNGR